MVSQTLCVFHLKWFYPNSVRNVNAELLLQTRTISQFAQVRKQVNYQVAQLHHVVLYSARVISSQSVIMKRFGFQVSWQQGDFASQAIGGGLEFLPLVFFFCVCYTRKLRGVIEPWIPRGLRTKSITMTTLRSVFYFSNPSLSVCRKQHSSSIARMLRFPATFGCYDAK